MVEPQSSKLITRVRFPSSAPLALESRGFFVLCVAALNLLTLSRLVASPVCVAS